MAKKFYAVKKGRKIGIFNSWDDCKAQVHGYPGAVYKSFSSREEALAWQNGLEGEILISEDSIETPGMPVEEDHLIAYVDGSFNGASYAFGAVLLGRTMEIYASQAFMDKEAVKLHNVAGELAGATYAMNYAMEQGFRKLTVCHDYTGIAQWSLGHWQAKLPLTQAYRDHAQKIARQLHLSFVKIDAHTGVYYNEMADRLAKTALEKHWETLYFKIKHKE